jgi:hypothetical protein
MTDFKSSDRDVNRAIRSWLHEDRHEDVSRIAGAVLDQVDTIPQRRATWWPARRTPTMNRIVTIGLGAAAVVVLAIFIGAQLLGSPSGGTGSGATPTPEPTATLEPTATPEPSPSPPASAAPLTERFTSSVHGISVSYPEGWTVLAATEPWTGCLYCSAVHSAPYLDVLLHPVADDGLFLRIASQPIGDSTPEDWVAAQMATDELDPPLGRGCTTTEPIIVDGATGLSGGDTCLVAVVTTAGRGYHIDLYVSPDNLDLVAQYDRAWFEEVLATVQLHPEDAVD